MDAENREITVFGLIFRKMKPSVASAHIDNLMEKILIADDLDVDLLLNFLAH